MIDEEIAKDFEREMTKDLPGTRVPLSIRPVPKPELKEVSLTEQWAVVEKFEHELRERIRKERVDIIAENDRRWTEIQNDYARSLSEMKAKLDKEREAAMRRLETETMARLRDNDLLSKRINRD